MEQHILSPPLVCFRLSDYSFSPPAILTLCPARLPLLLLTYPFLALFCLSPIPCHLAPSASSHPSILPSFFFFLSLCTTPALSLLSTSSLFHCLNVLVQFWMVMGKHVCMLILTWMMSTWCNEKLYKWCFKQNLTMNLILILLMMTKWRPSNCLSLWSKTTMMKYHCLCCIYLSQIGILFDFQLFFYIIYSRGLLFYWLCREFERGVQSGWLFQSGQLYQVAGCRGMCK